MEGLERNGPQTVSSIYEEFKFFNPIGWVLFEKFTKRIYSYTACNREKVEKMTRLYSMK